MQRQQPIVRRPKSDGRCTHCREPLTKSTKDHVFPSSWYPDTTPEDVQRWTAPSCESCNGHFDELEKDLLVFLACCIDPTKPAAQGLYERARRTMGIGVDGLAGGRIVEPPYEVEVFFPTKTPEFVDQLLTAFALGPVYLGPGLRIRRGGAHDDSLTALYELVMWDTLTLYASILPPATERVIPDEEIAYTPTTIGNGEAGPPDHLTWTGFGLLRS